MVFFNPSSSSAFTISSYVGARPCHPATFSMKLTPLPFTVFARSTVGLPADRNVLRLLQPVDDLRISWPSTSITSQPKLR